MSNVTCPDCRSPGWIRKGKSKDGKFQKLKCKNCGRQYQVEEFLVNKQMALPTFENRIVEHPDGTFSVDRVKMIDSKIGESLEQITVRKDTFGELMTIVRELRIEVNPTVIVLDKKSPRDQIFDLIKKTYPMNLSKMIIGYIKATEIAAKHA